MRPLTDLDSLVRHPGRRRSARASRAPGCSTGPHAPPSSAAVEDRSPSISPRGDCGATRPRPSTWPARAARWPWPRAPRRASRSATSCRSRRRRWPNSRRHRAAPLPDQGAGPGPAAGVHRPRRARPGRRAPTTATHRTDDRAWVRRHANVRADQPRHAPRRDPPGPRPLGHVPHAAAVTSWSTSCTRCGASSAAHVAHVLRRLRRLCAHYGSAPTFVLRLGDDRRAGDAGVDAVRAAGDRGDRRRLAAAANACSRCGTRRSLDERRAHGRRPTSRPAGVARRHWCAEGYRAIAFTRSRKAHRVGGAVRQAAPAARSWRDAVRAYRGGYLAASGARSRRSCSRAAAQAWPPPARSSSGIDVGALDAVRARRLPRHDRVDVAAGGPGRPHAATRRSPCWWRAKTSSTSGSWPTPRGVPPPARAGDRQPVQPLRAPPPPGVRGLRATAAARGRHLLVAALSRRGRVRGRGAKVGRRRSAGRAQPPGGVGRPRLTCVRRQSAHGGHGRVPHRRRRGPARRNGRRSRGRSRWCTPGRSTSIRASSTTSTASISTTTRRGSPR